ncbi:Acyl-[acyl-carrier-protein]--UDP-N-acetylglucosamine O-acyltransferase [Caloramator mitchellensis]|uniref:Acyl-[acyl-carrier-protein]--UDP-N-acetylglucosamine O-acyltransferase n=1 Tax=Caloramator mitchellensis TaxID=908809 RepID=A0A0R3JV86_CALMK|nr:gamma carbonic anhydrase family protein [Caloramator mitchellensis]KRQ86189.1 Acyl-[acyl-carrier-protein]--UDP-N-acetylglucosamine O-acyltransferase [Caloramator mitchellensis]
MIYKYQGITPKIDESVFIAEGARIIGDVEIKRDSNVWFNAVIRGDVGSIKIGEGTNIQDNATVHVSTNKSPTVIGDYVTVGHNCIIHGCKIGNFSLIGMGSTILDDAEIGEYTIIGAGSLVTQGKKIPSGVLAMGSPAKVVRELTVEEIEYLKKSAEHYIELSKKY